MKLILAVVAFLSFAMRIDAEEFSMPNTVAPRVTGASAAESNGSVFVHMITTHIVPETQKRIVLRDGEKVEETITVFKPVFESRATELAGEVKAFTRDGKELESKDVLQRLKNPTPIAVTDNGKLDSFYRAMFRDDIVVLSLPAAMEWLPPGTRPFNAMPVAPGQGPPALPPPGRAAPPAPMPAQ